MGNFYLVLAKGIIVEGNFAPSFSVNVLSIFMDI